MDKEAEAKISVIIPVYKVEACLPLCVDSVLRQSYENMEIWLVDDGSPDACGSICDGYARKDERIRVIHQANRGVSAARNSALDMCTGEYITFIDSDDYVRPDYVEMLYRLLVRNHADVSCCRWQEVAEGKNTLPDIADTSPDAAVTSPDTANILSDAADTSPDAEVLTRISAMEKLLYQRESDCFPWGKLFKANLFAGIRFPQGKFFEDFAIMYKVFSRVNRAVFSEYRGYYYLQRRESFMRMNFRPVKMDLVTHAKEVYDFIRTNYPQLQKAAASRVVRAYFNLYIQIPRTGQYRKERKCIEDGIRALRSDVLKDKAAKRGTKAALLLTYGSFGFFYCFRGLSELGKV